MTDALKRATRTFIQAFIGALLTSGVLAATAETGTLDLDALRIAGISCVAAGVIAVLSWAQNALEDSIGKAILKDEPTG